ncbi:F-box/RNI-like superfamily protein [Striga asiatica]|uniref:F-box/RNI-like superfamily protein n=1 Tax=Striga asiatica TaxID=4170 RepID=A0A5A7QQZ1_STRAF|nr:F-box/RNI-like superfamily protein [Striga asiatica]
MSSSKAISRLDVENPALSFENLGTPSIGLWKSYSSLVARGAPGAADPVACQRVYTPKYVKSYSPDWFGFTVPGDSGNLLTGEMMPPSGQWTMFTVPDPEYFHLDVEYKVDPFTADLIANCPPPLKKSSSECHADSPEPCRICYNTHGFSQCPYVCSSYPRGADFNREYFEIACPCCVGYSSFDVDKWVCNACGRKIAALARKYCIICRSFTKHCTYECPKDEALAAQHNLLRYKPKASPYVPESSLNDS